MIPGCTGKHPYRTAVRAWRVARRGRSHSARRRCKTLDVYRCCICGSWHIGKNFRSARAALRWEED
jgi:hypothetical protein